MTQLTRVYRLICCGLVVTGSLALGTTAAWADDPPDAAEVSNVSVNVRGNYVDITYDLTQAQGLSCVVWARLSTDGGVSYDNPITTVTGDVRNVMPGTGKVITWNAYVDYPGEYITEAGIRVDGIPMETIVLPGDVSLDMVLIPAGTFMMGSPDSDADASSDEKPQHAVTLTNGFWMSCYEVTQAQWVALMGNNPSRWTDDNALPVDTVGWSCCQGFLVALNAAYPGSAYRLPTEAEWEYACRAETTTRFHWGDDEDYSELSDYAWCAGTACTHPVGGKAPNRWGLYDMHGNLYEWCQDWYGVDYYASSPGTDPTGPGSGPGYVMRGASWGVQPSNCRTADRLGISDAADNHYGFRIVCNP